MAETPENIELTEEEQKLVDNILDFFTEEASNAFNIDDLEDVSDIDLDESSTEAESTTLDDSSDVETTEKSNGIGSLISDLEVLDIDNTSPSSLQDIADTLLEDEAIMGDGLAGDLSDTVSDTNTDDLLGGDLDDTESNTNTDNGLAGDLSDTESNANTDNELAGVIGDTGSDTNADDLLVGDIGDVGSDTNADDLLGGDIGDVGSDTNADDLLGGDIGDVGSDTNADDLLGGDIGDVGSDTNADDLLGGDIGDVGSDTNADDLLGGDIGDVGSDTNADDLLGGDIGDVGSDTNADDLLGGDIGDVGSDTNADDLLVGDIGDVGSDTNADDLLGGDIGDVGSDTNADDLLSGDIDDAGSDTNADDLLGGDIDDAGSDTNADDLLGGDIGDVGSDTNADDLLSGDIDDAGSDTNADDLLGGDIGDVGSDTNADDLLGGDIDDAGSDTNADDLLGGDIGDVGSDTNADDLLGGDIGDVGSDTNADDLLSGDIDDAGSDTNADDLLGGDIGDVGSDTNADDLLSGDIGDVGSDTNADDLLGGDIGDVGSDTNADDLLGGDIGDVGSDTNADDLLGGDIEDVGSDTNADDLLGGDIGDVVSDSNIDDLLGGVLDDAEPDSVAPPNIDDLIQNVSTVSSAGENLEEEFQYLSEQEKLNKKVLGSDLKILHGSLATYPYKIRMLIAKAILEDLLNDKAIKELISLVTSGLPISKIIQFLETHLGASIDDLVKQFKLSPKVIISDAKFTKKHVSKHKKLVRKARWLIFYLVLLFSLLFTFYFLGIKQYYYTYLVGNLVDSIINEDLTKENQQSIEEEFLSVIDYNEESTYAYLQIGKAYMYKNSYESAFEKIFGKIEFIKATESKSIHYTYNKKSIQSSTFIWNILERAPNVEYIVDDYTRIKINNIPYRVITPGAFLLDLQDSEVTSNTLLALGEFHRNPAVNFQKLDYYNLDLSMSYFNLILNLPYDQFSVLDDTDLEKAIDEMGYLLYQKQDYNRALQFYESNLSSNPKSISAHAGILRTLLKLYEESSDPTIILAHHNRVYEKLDIESNLPSDVLCKLAGFYIDLPKEDDFRVKYNVYPTELKSYENIKQRAYRLILTVLNKSSKEDNFGHVTGGRTYADAYYYLGRYYNTMETKYVPAAKQFKQAFETNPLHFPALIEHAKVLLTLNDYQQAIEVLNLAESIAFNGHLDNLGLLPEDELSLDTSLGLIPFLLAKSIYLSNIQFLNTERNWIRIQEVKKFSSTLDYGIEGLFSALDRVEFYLEKSRNLTINNNQYMSEWYYYYGWIEYVRGNYREALSYWQLVPEDKIYTNSDLLLAKANTTYYLGLDAQREDVIFTKYLKLSLGYLLHEQKKVLDQISLLTKVNKNNIEHIQIFNKASIVHNNIGALYEVLGNRKLANKFYLDSVNYAKSIYLENEIANLNLILSFKREGLSGEEKTPVLMDFVSPSFNI